MLLHMYKVPEALFITVTVITVLFALARTNSGKTGRIIMLSGIGLGLTLAVLRAVTHEFPALFFPDRKAVPDTQINLILWYIAMGILVPLHVLSAVFSREKGSRAGKTAVSVLSALLSADLLAYKAWAVIWAPRDFETGDNGILSDVFLLRLAGWLAGLLLLAVYARFLYKCCMRLSEDRTLWNDWEGMPQCDGQWVLRLTAALMTFFLFFLLYGMVLQQWTVKTRPSWVPELLPQLNAETFLKFTVRNNASAGGPLFPGWKWYMASNHAKGGYLENGVLMLLLCAVMAMIPPAVLFLRSLCLRDVWKNAAQKRRLRSDNRHNRRWSAIVLVSLVCVMLCLTVVYEICNRPPPVPEGETYTIVFTDEDGTEREIAATDVKNFDASRVEVRIPLNQVDDYNLHAFEMNRSGSPNKAPRVRWIVIRKPGSAAYGVGLDACDVCGSAGYYQRGDTVVCKRCDVVMNTNTIGLAGGCNPIPLAFRVEDGCVVIAMEDLMAGEKEFK
ncbi:MAG: DUF2318 domain-containing protein [Clostridia bacterium]|nr:DUF2318 domain-containing protein [Clostridia bacterium]